MNSKELPNYPSPRISSEINDCSLPLTFDTYSKCSMSCRYCFSSVQKCNTPGASTAPLQAANIKRLERMIDGDSLSIGEDSSFHKYLFKNRFVFHWGGLSDPFCGLEKRYGAGYELLNILADRKYPTLFSFKGDTILQDKYLKVFDDNKHHCSFAFQFSIVTADDDLAKKVETGVPAPSKRFEIMKILSDMGYWCILRLRPYIIGVTNRSIDAILEKGLNAGMNAISTEFYAMEGRNNPQAVEQYRIMEELMQVKDLHQYYKALSPSERGTYKRLNRDVKEPYVKKLYKFCADNKLVFACSDPDFKELSMTPCCCALPESHPDNPEFNNYLRNQLTRSIVNARRLYHKTGELAVISFDDTYGIEHSFLDDIPLSHQNYGCTAFNYAYRKQLTTRHILQQQWNTLFSPANPRNYFAGKILPIGIDDNNLLFKYNPMEYERRWKEEGIDLTL